MALVIAIALLKGCRTHQYEQSRFAVVVSFEIAITGTHCNQSRAVYRVTQNDVSTFAK